MRDDFGRYAEMIPKGLKENLAFRKAAVEYGRSGEAEAHDLWRMCSRDVLFFTNAFVWTYDPRLSGFGLPTTQPFITYDFQDDLIRAIYEAMGFIEGLPAHDLGIGKSRDMGVTWAVVIVFDWATRFRYRLSFSEVSRKQDLVDNGPDQNTLFAKHRFIEEHLPGFLTAPYRDTIMRLANEETQSVISGESTTGQVGVGGRSAAIFLDEFSRFAEQVPGSDTKVRDGTADTTECRIIVGTPFGTGNEFYTWMHDGSCQTHIVHWSQHPRKAEGLYKVGPDGEVEILDTAWHEAHPGYEFVREPGQYEGLHDARMKGVRSPWYDRECRRRASKQFVAQHLDIHFLGSGSQFFDAEMLAYHKSFAVMDPFRTGTVQEFVGDLKIDERLQKAARLWCVLDGQGKPPQYTSYAMGCDISTGTGASDSAMTVCDRRTGETVFKYVTNRVLPEDFAIAANAVARWFSTPVSQCFVAWEATGVGETFGTKLVTKLGYGHVYHYKNEADLKANRAGKPGWYNAGSNKYQLLVSYRESLGKGEFVNRSLSGIEQASQYINTPTGPEHSRQRSASDPSGNKEQHGDEVIADAICNMAMREKVEALPAPQNIPYGCLKWRMEQQRKEALEEAAW